MIDPKVLDTCLKETFSRPTECQLYAEIVAAFDESDGIAGLLTSMKNYNSDLFDALSMGFELGFKFYKYKLDNGV